MHLVMQWRHRRVQLLMHNLIGALNCPLLHHHPNLGRGAKPRGGGRFVPAVLPGLNSLPLLLMSLISSGGRPASPVSFRP